MKIKSLIKCGWLVLTSLVLLSGCQNRHKGHTDETAVVLAVIQKHLNAVSKKDLITLKETLSPDGDMQLILPQSEIIQKVAGFMKFHEDWFAAPGWTFETQVLNNKVGDKLAMVVVEIVYRESDRDGQPYFNRMVVSYVLKKLNGHWYVIKDHASSVEKSTGS